MKTVSGKVVGAFIGLTNRAKIFDGGGGWGRPIVPEILDQSDPRWCEIADFRSIFARSASAVTPV